MIGRLVSLTWSMDRKQLITVEVDDDFRDKYQKLKGKEIDIDIRPHRKKRSKDANAYLHVLISKIAAAQNLSEDEVKRHLVLQYGAQAMNEDGTTIGVKVPSKTNISQLWPYTKCFNQRWENGTLFSFYIVYKGTHEMDTKEMARLIDGAVWEAKELGIETATPDEIARMKGLYGIDNAQV